MQLHTEQWGPADGQLVVCLHGVTSRLSRFRRLANEALPGFRVVGVDLRGHGELGLVAAVGRRDARRRPARDGRRSRRSGSGTASAACSSPSSPRARPSTSSAPCCSIPRSTSTPRRRSRRPRRSGSRRPSARSTSTSTSGTPPARSSARRASWSRRRAPRTSSPARTRRLRVHYCRSTIVTAWSEMATPAPPLPECPTLRRARRGLVDPVPRGAAREHRDREGARRAHRALGRLRRDGRRGSAFLAAA